MHARYMRAALSIARRGLGSVWPNPSVGCLVVNSGQIVGRGWTGFGGRPHAETLALKQAGDAAKNSCVYVTLEPCSHHGKTGPCAEALIAAGVKRVVAAVRDPDPRVNGEGIEILRRRHVEVIEGVEADSAVEVNAGFFMARREGRPFVTLKLASTIDGRIGTRNGESKWITGAAARAYAHLLRATHDAVLVGSGTILADDPELTCRLPFYSGRQPIRIVMDGRLRLPKNSYLAQTANFNPVWVLTKNASLGDELGELGCELIQVSADSAGKIDCVEALEILAKRGITRLLIEGGGKLAASMLAVGLVDKLEMFRAPAIVGGDGIPAADSLGINNISNLIGFRRVRVRNLEKDLLESYIGQVK